MHFDPTVSLGNILTFGTCLLLAILGWHNLTWRVKNLETWRIESTKATEKLINRIDALMERRGVFVRGESTEPYPGPERRHK